MTWVLVSDIDGTLTGDERALGDLGPRLRDLRARDELGIILCTGRRLDQVIDGFATEGLPEPDGVICQVGTEIYVPPFTPGASPMREWDEHLHRGFDRGEALRFLAGIDGLVMQPGEFNTPLKVSAYLDRSPDPEAAAREIRGRVAAHAGGYQVVWSSGRDLDILPAASGKGKAARFLVRHLGLPDDRVIAAGDTGNDIALFDEFGRGVIVANAQPELMAYAKSRRNGTIHLATEPYAAGVRQGLRAFGVL